MRNWIPASRPVRIQHNPPPTEMDDGNMIDWNGSTLHCEKQGRKKEEENVGYIGVFLVLQC